MKYRNLDDCKFEVRVLCRDCGKTLNSTVPMTDKEIRADWTRLVLSSGFVTPRCSGGCRATFSDLNINTSMPIYDLETQKPIEFELFKFLRGNFYSDDHDKVCECKRRRKDETYETESYPAVHGLCGKWLKRYESKS
jgi:hypothetical protein